MLLGDNNNLIMDFEVRQFSEADVDDVSDLSRAVYGDASAEAFEKRWRWEFKENPFAGKKEPLLVALSGSELIGTLFVTPMKLKVDDSVSEAGWVNHFMVHPDYRNRGVGRALLLELKGRWDTVFMFPASALSCNLALKAGWFDVGLVHPRRLPLRRSFLGLFSIPPNSGKKFGSNAGISANTDVSEIQSFDKEFDTLWSRVSKHLRISAVRGSAYLNWRYVSCPVKSYRILKAEIGGELKGFMVVSVEKKAGRIVDFLVGQENDSVFGALLNEAINFFVGQKLEFVESISVGGNTANLLGRRGFELKKGGLFFIGRTSAKMPGQSVLADLGGWHLTFGDSNADYLVF